MADWRCPKCGRLFSSVVSKDKIEVRTSNNQTLTFKSSYIEAHCKCGSVVTYGKQA